MNLKICCIKLSLATRVIAMVGLITSVLVLTQLFTELAEKDGNGTVSILLGLDVDEFTQFNSQSTQGSEIMIAFLFFSLIYAVASAILIWGSIVEVSWYAIPWLVCEALSFGTQIATVTMHAINFQKKRNDRWIILLSIFNLFLSVYFWIVVFSAQRSWAKDRKQERENASTSTLSSGNETIPDDVFENTAPPLPEKCVEV
uniref:Putative conserved plasma membrane protein n=1 Tax=Panstrongylus lignarius TaxID=156445 RepID=A0A224XPS6_9HEMI